MPTPKKANDPKTLPGEDTSADDTVTTNTDDATEPIATYDEAGNKTTSTTEDDVKAALVAEANNPSQDKVDRELAKVSEDTTKRSEVDSGLVEVADTGPRRQGNAYGVSRDAVENFKRDAERDLAEAEAEVERLEAVIADYEYQLSDQDAA